MPQKENDGKNVVLELLRFIFATYIIFFHLDKDILGHNFVVSSFGFVDITFFRNGFIGVEFFFMLTGLFMAERIYSLDKENNYVKIGEDTLNY